MSDLYELEVPEPRISTTVTYSKISKVAYHLSETEVRDTLIQRVKDSRYYRELGDDVTWDIEWFVGEQVAVTIVQQLEEMSNE